MAPSREAIILAGQRRGASSSEINSVLSRAGYPALPSSILNITPSIRQPIKPKAGKYNLGKEIVEDLGDAWKGLGTAGTIAWEGLKHPIKSYEGLSQYAQEKGAVGILNDLANTALSTYNTSTSDIANRRLGVLPDVLRGAAEHPVFAAMDLATLGVGKPIGAIKELGAQALYKSAAPKVLKAMLPTAEMNEVNAILKNRKLVAETANKQLKSGIEKIANDPNVNTEAIVAAYTKGTELPSNVNKATKDAYEAFHTINKDINKQFHQVTGLTEDVTKREAISKYMLENLDPDRTLGLKVSDVKSLIDKYTSGGKWDTKLPFSQQEIGKLLNQGENLYGTGKVLHVSELMVKDKGLSGFDVPQADLGYLTERMVGKATPKDIAENLFHTYGFLADELTRLKSATGAMDDTLRRLGTKVDDINNPQLKEGEVLISPKLYEEYLNKVAFKGSTKQTGGAISRAMEGIKPNDLKTLEKHKGSLYKIDKGLLDSLSNAYNATAGNKANRMFKAAQLSTPKWFLEGRYGNTILNALEGVSPTDYLQAHTKYKKYIPEELKSATSLSGYLGTQATGPKLIEAEKLAMNKLLKGIKDKSPTLALEGINQVFSNPFVLAEANAEKFDRWANMIRQAKRYSKESKIPLEKVMKTIGEDKDLFFELNKRVDRSLGDYLGRNYYLPRGVQSSLNWATPFYKFPSNAARITFEQLGRNPLRSQAMTVLPAKAGSQEWERIKKKWHLSDDEIGGIVLRDPTLAKMLKWKSDPREMVRFNANPLETGLGMAYQLASGDLSSAASLLSPIFTNVSQIANFRNSYGQSASSPDYINYMGKTYNIKTGEEVTHPSAKDIGTMALAKLAQTFVTPAVQADRAILPYSVAMLNAIDKATGKEPQFRYYPKYDTSITGHVGIKGAAGKGLPMFRGNVLSGKKDVDELTASLVGERRYQSYPKFDNPKQSRRIRKAIIKKINKKLYRSER